jgi:hypothetical protein
MNTNANTKSKNPGISLLKTTLSAGTLTMELFKVAAEYSLKYDDYAERLAKRKEILLAHLTASTTSQIEQTQGKEHVSIGVNRLREAAIIAAAGYPEGDPVWDFFHLNVPLSNSEFGKIAERLHQKLHHSSAADKELGFEYMAAAGFMISDITYKMSNGFLEKLFLKEMLRQMPSIKMQVAREAVEESFQDIHKAIGIASLLEEQGVTFNAEGDPEYSQEYQDYKQKAKEKENEYRNNNSTNNRTDPGTEGPHSTI